jgi:hypothetical protein
MIKRTYFDTYSDPGWPDSKWLERYFLTSSGRRDFFASGNDSWGLKAEGVDGTDHLPPMKGRVDVDLTILGHPDLGVLLHYFKYGRVPPTAFYSKGDLTRLRQTVKTAHGDKMPIGLFIPFETAWMAVKEFMERDAALPTSIEWLAGADIPADVFPPP